MTDIDPIAIIGVITTVLGIFVTYFATNARALRYLKVAQKLTEVADSYFKGNADKVWSDLEYQEFGKEIIELVVEVQNDLSIPAEVKSLDGQNL